MNEKERKKIIEGLLFLSGDEGLSVQQLASVLECANEEIEISMHMLINDLKDNDRALEIVMFNQVYKFVTKKEIYVFAEKIYADVKMVHLSNAAMETLAIIAYRQPITRIEIEEIRGVGVDMMIRKLQARSLVEECGRSDAPGRPILYKVTNEFLDTFKLANLEELPDLPKVVVNEQLFD